MLLKDYIKKLDVFVKKNPQALLCKVIRTLDRDPGVIEIDPWFELAIVKNDNEIIHSDQFDKFDTPTVVIIEA